MAIFSHIATMLCCVPAAAVALMVPEKCLEAKRQKKTVLNTNPLGTTTLLIFYFSRYYLFYHISSSVFSLSLAFSL